MPMLLDVDECAKQNGGCDSKRNCTNTLGGMTCGECPAGWANEGDKGCKGLFVSAGGLLLQKAVVISPVEMQVLLLNAHTLLLHVNECTLFSTTSVLLCFSYLCSIQLVIDVQGVSSTTLMRYATRH